MSEKIRPQKYNFDRMLSNTPEHTGIYFMSVEQLQELLDDVNRFKYQIVERIQQLNAPPPTLGVHVQDTIETKDTVGP